MVERGYRLSEAAKLLGVNPATLRNWIFKGVRGKKLKAYKAGALWYVTASAIEEWKDGCTPPLVDREEERSRRAWALEARRRHNI